ncbi:MAG TPA: metallopeptidase family protein [Phycisphaerae bacterium]|nr:metallopeptidase family protein [Phycisphaerae bacterium]
MQLTHEAFADAVSEALDSLPDDFRPYMEDLVVDIEDSPDAQTMADLGMKDRRSLLGLYRGVPLTKRSVGQMLRIPERIVLYQRNIERICRTRDEVVNQIRRTVLHEVGHHFGMGEAQLRRLGY